MSAAKLRVLLVDDDPAILRMLKVCLERAGYEVDQAHDGGQALEAIEAQCPDFLITDWEMPVVNGLELCRRVRDLSLPRYVYILVVSIYSAPDEIIHGLEAGADDFVVKPVHTGELLARLRSGARRLALEHRLQHSSRTDSLTGLMNQAAFYDSLEKEWHRAGRYHLPLSCVMLDLDYFKRINDTHGHLVGDLVLRAVGKLLQAGGRGSDSLCRYGGEEFCAFLPETDEAQAALWAERLRGHLAELTIPAAGQEIRITGSFGVAQRHDGLQKSGDLVDQADQALLCAKQSGRDRVIRHSLLGNTPEAELLRGGIYQTLFRGITARDVMRPMAACLRENEPIDTAAEFFVRARINSWPVVDAGGRLVGILSEKDVIAAMASLDCWRSRISRYMRPHVISYEEDTPLATIYEFLSRVSIRRIVIVRGACPTGTISRGTLLRWFRNLLRARGLADPGSIADSCGDLAAQETRQRLTETAHELSHQAAELEEDLDHLVDPLSATVGRATQIETLINDLLAFSRTADSRDANRCPGEPGAIALVTSEQEKLEQQNR
jgi:diguanylate cyclase (GGDEF)-like protein